MGAHTSTQLDSGKYNFLPQLGRNGQKRRDAGGAMGQVSVNSARSERRAMSDS